jgi:serine/threonine-protein kinase
MLPTEFALDAEHVARFKRETQVLASLNDPHIAGIYGLEGRDGQEGRDGPPLALVLELVEGPTLADRIAQGPMPLDEVLPIARQIAEALEAAHEQGIIHRDLKPANIKVRPDGTVKVLDFGLAKLADTMAGEAGGAGGLALSQSPTITTPAMMTGIGTILGTAAYMSPEQAKGRPADKRSDIWAFGCVLFEMLTGKRAFEGDDVSETLASVLKSEPDWTAWPAAVPVAIRVLVERCLAKDRRQRVGDVSTALFVLREAPSIGSKSKGTPSRGHDGSRRRNQCGSSRRHLAAAAGWSLQPSAAPPTVTRFWLKLPEDEQQLAIEASSSARSADGTRTVHSAKQQLWLRTLSDFGSTRLQACRRSASTVRYFRRMVSRWRSIRETR